MKRFQRSRLRASIFSSSTPGGGKCGSPDSARCARYTASAGRTISSSNSTRRAFNSSERALGAKSISWLLRVRGEELDVLRWCRECGLRRGEQLGGLRAVVGGQRSRRRAELDRDAAGVVRVDRGAPTVIDPPAFEAEVEPTL